MTYDQAQSPRLAQPTPVESTYVRMFTGTDLPEVSWHGQIIFRTDARILQVFNAQVGARGSWEDVAGGAYGHLTYVGADPPVAESEGDTWYDTDDGYKQYVWVLTPAPPHWQPIKAEGGIKTFRQASPPISTSIGDIWYDLDDQEKMYRAAAVGTSIIGAGGWVLVRDGQIPVLSSQVATKTQTFNQPRPPPVANAPGDIWFDADNGYRQYRASHGGANSIQDTPPAPGWYLVQDELIPTAVATANGKNTIYWADAEPTGGQYKDGDTWFDTNDNNKIYSYALLSGWTLKQLGEGSLEIGSVTANEISTGYAYVGDLLADQIVGGQIRFGIGIGARIETPVTPDGGQVVIDPTGIRIIGSETTTLQPNFSEFKGQAEVSNITVKGTATLRSTTNEVSRGGKLSLSAGVTPPGTAPSYNIDWAPIPLTGFDFTGFGVKSLQWEASTSLWIITISGLGTPGGGIGKPTIGGIAQMLRFNPNGTYHSTIGTAFNYQSAGGVISGVYANSTSWYLWEPGAGDIYLWKPGTTYSYTENKYGAGTKSLVADGDAVVYIAEAHTVASEPRVRLYGRACATGIPSGNIDLAMMSAQSTPPNAVYCGSGDFGEKTWMVASATSSGNLALVVPDAGVGKNENSYLSFPLPPQTPGGFGYDGTDYWTLGSDKVLYRHEHATKINPSTDSAHWWAASTWMDTAGTPHETSMSPVVDFQMKSRARLTINTAPVLAIGGGEDPTAAGIYLGRKNASSVTRTDLYYQGNTTTTSSIITAPVWTGANPPAAGNFPDATPAALVSGAGGFVLNGDGTGAWPALASSIQATAIPIGTIWQYGGATAPAGWLFCRGQLVPTTGIYAALYAVVAHAFNAGVNPGGGNFKLPDLQQRFPLGAGVTALGAAGGTVSHTHQATHTHSLPDHTHGNTGYNNTTISSVPGGGGRNAADNNHVHATNYAGLTGTYDSNTPTTGGASDWPPFQAINFIIKY